MSNVLKELSAMVRPMMQDRPYHNAVHVEACLAALNRYRHLAGDPQALELALWLHDAVYDSTRHDNEARSAERGDAWLAERGATPEVIRKVHELVLATRHDVDPGTQDGRLIADIDLLILSEPPDVFDRYEQQIRQEYSHVPESDFARGRLAVLKRLLEREPLYYLLPELEAAARQNLQRSIARWQAVVDGVQRPGG